MTLNKWGPSVARMEGGWKEGGELRKKDSLPLVWMSKEIQIFYLNICFFQGSHKLLCQRGHGAASPLRSSKVGNKFVAV